MGEGLPQNFSTLPRFAMLIIPSLELITYNAPEPLPRSSAAHQSSLRTGPEWLHGTYDALLSACKWQTQKRSSETIAIRSTSTKSIDLVSPSLEAYLLQEDGREKICHLNGCPATDTSSSAPLPQNGGCQL